MGKTIEVRLSDAQCEALAAEAEAAGQKFFDYCRAKLTGTQFMYGRGPAMADLPVVRADNQRRRDQIVAREADDRIARIEDAVAQLTAHVLGQTQQPIDEPQPAAPLDVNSIVDEQFQQAEAQGLTQRVPDVNEEVMQAAGVRPLSRRPIPYSPATAPKHLAQFG